MAVNLSPVGGVAAQFFTNTGAVLTGGKIYTYAAGTTTPAVTYTSGAGNVAWTNPIVLDAAGRVSGSGEIWLTDGVQYKFVLKDSNDVLIATYDNITGINSNFVNFVAEQEIQTATAGQTVFTLTTTEYQPGANTLSVFVDGVNQYGPGAQYAYTETSSTVVTFVSGLHVGASVKFTTTQTLSGGAVDASQVTYDPPFVDSVPTSVEAKLSQYISVIDFGADPTGVADSTAEIQAAITAGNQIYFPAGTYRVDSVITLKSDLAINFAAGAKIQIANGIDSYVFQGTSLTNLSFVNMTVLGNGQAAGNNTVQLNTCTNVLFDNCTIQKSRGTAIQLISCSNVKVQNCDLSYNYYYGCEDRGGIGNKFVNSLFYSNGDTGVTTAANGRGLVLWKCHDTYVAGNRFKANTEYGFRIYSVTGETSAEGIADARIIGNFFSDNDGIDLYCYNESTYVTSVVIADNIIERNQAPAQACVTLSGSNITATNTHIRAETLLGTTSGFSLYGSTNVTLSDCSTKNIGYAISMDGSSNPQTCTIDNFFGNGMVKVGVVYGAGHRIRNSKFVHAGAGTTDTCLDLTSVSGKVWVEGCLFDGFEYGIKIGDAAVALKLNTTQNSTANGLRKYNNSLAAIELVSNSWTDSAYPSELNNINKTNSPYDQAIGFYPTSPLSLTWTVGDVIFNDTPSVGQPKGWVCTVAGTPGTWVSQGNL